ncbi:FAD:protein FMN transferase [Sphingomonas sp. DT-207]|uniref:FAD:protein FMN transferase n=1 Tax=Sphingomonas sp. DT-207 TaxID=3396167 RepID=UPI003F1DBA2D
MGTSWSVRLVSPDEAALPRIEQDIEAVLGRIIAQMSQWEQDSVLSRFNRVAIGRWQALPADFLNVLRAGIEIGQASQGAFDPTKGALVELWGFGASGPVAAPPSPGSIADAAARSGPGSVELDLLLFRARRRCDAALDFSGIAKGYAVDAVAAQLIEAGITDFLVEIGGELRGAGIKPDGQPWWVEMEPVPGSALPPLRVALHELAVATSGDYRRGFAHAGRRFAHTLDPRTGWPVDNRIASATVLHAQAMYADAWATALTVLGPEEGLALAEREGLTARLVMRTEDGGFAERLSPALEAMLG